MEPLVLLCLAGLVDPKLSGFSPEDVAAVSGVSADDLREIAGAFDKPKKGVVIASMQAGRSGDPQLLSLVLQLLVSRMKGDKKLLSAGLDLLPLGRQGLGSILAGIKDHKIGVAVNIGDGFPFFSLLSGEERQGLKLTISTATMRPKEPVPGWVLPVPLNLEKTGTVKTMWGEAALNSMANPVSGARPIEEIIRGLTGDDLRAGDIPAEPFLTRVGTKTVTDQGRAMLKQAAVSSQQSTVSGQKTGDEHPYTIIAEQPAYGFRDLFTKSSSLLALHPHDATELKVRDGEAVKVETTSGSKAEFRAHISEQVLPGCCMVNLNDDHTRSLFQTVFDNESGMAATPPAQARIWRSE
jgi:hypothetical protein